MYIQLINKTYRYRYKLPKDINFYFPANEITKSLHTNNIEVAKVKAMKIHSTIVEIIHKVRMSRDMSLLTDFEIYNLTEKYLSERLTSDYRARIEKSSFNGLDENRIPTYKNAMITREILENMRRDISLLKLSVVKDLAEQLTGVPMDDSEASHKSFLFELLRTSIVLFTEIQNRNDGIYSANYTDTKQKEAPKAITTVKKAFYDYVTYQEKEYSKSSKGRKALADTKTQTKFKVAPNMDATLRFLERDWLYLIGTETDIDSDSDTVLDAIDILEHMPSRNGAIQNVSAEDLWKHESVEKITQHTYAKHVGKIKAFYTWCFLKGKCTTQNIADELPEIDKDAVQREELTNKEIQILLAVVSEDMQLFVKVFLYSGMRRSELWRCTLLDEGFDLNEATTKNKPSKRLIPKHTELLNIPSSTIERIRTMYSMHSVSRTINQAIREHIAPNSKKKVFHSMRHSFATSLLRHDVPENLANELMGHSFGKTMSYSTYGHGSQFEILRNTINKVNYEVVTTK